jgi:hypothetical protein
VRRDLPGGLCRAIDAAVQPEPAVRAGLVTLRAALSDAVQRVADQRGPIAFGPPDGSAEPASARTDRTPRNSASVRDRWDAAEAELTRDPQRPSQAHDRGPQLARERERILPPDLDRAGSSARGGRRRAEEPQRAPRMALVPRLAAAAAAAAISAAALAWLGPEPTFQPAPGAAAAATAVLLLPRLGWLAMAAALVAWLAVAAPGVALLVVAAAAPVALLLPLSGTSWSLPALAPLLAAAGLAGVWPALAGQARRWPVRAGLGALGGWWIALMEALTSQRLVFGPPHDAAARTTWEGSAVDAGRDALWPLMTGGALALALLWAIAALLLPVLVRGRSAALDLVGAAAWAATLAAATQALSQALVLDPPRALVAGAVAAGVVAVAARALGGRARRPRAAQP